MKIRHVLVPLDHSKLAEAALEYALDIVDPQGSITLLTVIEPSEYTRAEEYPVIESSIALSVMSGDDLTPTTRRTEAERQARENAEHYLYQMASKLQKPEQFVRTLVEEGKPAERILAVAHELKVDAIVMSTHGRSGLSRWVFGSVAQKVVSGAECPVLLIPQRSVPGS